jgi:hypothetical protein
LRYQNVPLLLLYIYLYCLHLRDWNPLLPCCWWLNFILKVMVFVLNEAMIVLLDHIHPCHYSEIYKWWKLRYFFICLQSLEISVRSLGAWLTCYVFLDVIQETLTVWMALWGLIQKLHHFWTFLDFGNWKIHIEKQ